MTDDKTVARYHLSIDDNFSLRVTDRHSGCVLVDWRGAVVRCLLERRALPVACARAGTYGCDKVFVWHLILAGASARMLLDRLGYTICSENPPMASTTIKTIDDLRAVVGEPHPDLGSKNIDYIDKYAREFIERCPFVVLSTSDSDGRLDASPKGDAAGFVEVIDDRTIVIPDRPGNKLAYGHLNILSNPQVGLLFVIPNTPETLRINGRAELCAEPDLLNKLTARGKPAILAIRVTVDECFFHCAKAFLRSGLWKPDSWAERHRVSFGEMWAARKSQPEAVAAVIDEAIEADYRDNL